jgi:nucleotide-binding universal stress UspA family protein
MRFHKILFPTDFSSCANRALPYALTWASRFGGELEMLHAIILHGYQPLEGLQGFPDQEEIYEYFRRTAEEEMDQIRSSHPAVVKQVHRRGVAAAPVILDHLAEHEVDLVVMATHGRRGPRRLLVGSVTEEVIRKSPCPVLTIKADEAHEQGDGIHRILVPLDFSEGCREALTTAHELASTFGAELDLLHVVEQPPYPVFYEAVGGFADLYPPGLEDESRRHLEALCSECGIDSSTAKTTVRTGIPGEEILAHASEHGADLIVVPTHGLTGVAYALLGSVTEKLVRRAECPVLVTRCAGAAD